MKTEHLLYAASGLAVVTMLYTVALIWVKLVARKHLVTRLVKHQEMIEIIRAFHQLEVDRKKSRVEILELQDEIIKQIEAELKNMDFVERKSIYTGLYQSSAVGREDYLEDLCNEVESKMSLTH